MKKVVLAFDSFKGCISAQEACEACAQGVHAACQNAVVVQIPLSDGGEGLVECVRRMLPTRSVAVEVHGPLMDKVKAEYAISADGKTAYMEMAAASGITLVPPERRNPLEATTYGVGEMIADAVKRGCREIVMGIGGSATCDGGRGMVEALKDCRCLDMDCQVIAACDVNNPLFGKNGAAYVFAPQKGATPEMVGQLDRRAQLFAEKSALHFGFDRSAEPGAGAAGGLGYAFMQYLGAEMKSGADLLLDIIGFDEKIKGADLIITGEGGADRQTLMGKLPQRILMRGQQTGVPVALVAGCVSDRSLLTDAGFTFVESITPDGMPIEEAVKKEVASRNLRRFAASLG